MISMVQEIVDTTPLFTGEQEVRIFKLVGVRKDALKWEKRIVLKQFAREAIRERLERLEREVNK